MNFQDQERMIALIMERDGCERPDARKILKKELIELMLDVCAREGVAPFSDTCGIVRDPKTGVCAFLLRWRHSRLPGAAIYLYEPKDLNDGLLSVEIFEDEHERAESIEKTFMALRAAGYKPPKPIITSEGDVHVQEHWRRWPYTAGDEH